MSRKGYIFTNKDNSQKGIMSTILGVLTNITLFFLIYFSFLKRGLIPDRYAAAMLLTFLFSLTGLILGGAGIFEKEKYRLFPVIGLALNTLAMGIISFIIYLSF